MQAEVHTIVVGVPPSPGNTASNSVLYPAIAAIGGFFHSSRCPPMLRRPTLRSFALSDERRPSRARRVTDVPDDGAVVENLSPAPIASGSLPPLPSSFRWHVAGREPLTLSS
jgi:hypothetical protein